MRCKHEAEQTDHFPLLVKPRLECGIPALESWPRFRLGRLDSLALSLRVSFPIAMLPIRFFCFVARLFPNAPFLSALED